MKHKIFLTIITIIISQYSYTQCIDCVNSNAIATSSIIGRNNATLGVGSIVMGINSQTGNLAPNSIAMGSYVKTIAGMSFIIGHGINSNYMLQNNMNRSLMVGFNSNVPTFFVGRSTGLNSTGKIAIGNIINSDGQYIPLQKLHLKADEEEIAAILIEPHIWDDGSTPSGGGIDDTDGSIAENTNGAYLMLGNENHGIGAINNVGLIFNSEYDYLFGEGNVGINTTKPEYNLHVEGSLFTKQFTLFNEENIPRSGFVLVSDDKGNGFWVDPMEYGLWKTNPSSETDIYYNTGNVGIGTINTYGYSLAVAGKILTDEVMVKHYDTWPDYVFEPEYKLMPLDEVETFVKTNKHLPNVKSQEEVKDGYGLSEMNAVLLQKVEELTLYIIEQQKEMEAQKKLVKSQQEEINEIKEILTSK